MYHGNAVTNYASPYFDGARKGEINELRQHLKTCLAKKDDKKRLEIIKKVISYMTQGIDVSRLFSEMCMASYTDDMVQKKLIYLYLSTYVEKNQDLAVMAINTYLKDCQNNDPKIRGLALRSLSNLKLNSVIEYMMPAIQEAINDMDPYVRKTAVIACVKLFNLSPSTILSNLYSF